MSSDLQQLAKEKLAVVLALAESARTVFLDELQSRSPELYKEVLSLLASQATTDGQELVDSVANGDADAKTPPVDHHTADFDPARTNEFLSVGNLKSDLVTQHSQDLVGPEYELHEKIGQGGMGVVYKAYHRSLRRTVALKIITGGGLRDETDIARFQIEAEAAARLDHPGIIPVYDVGEHNGNHYYAMAYVEGPSLSEFVGPEAKLLSPRKAAELMEQVSRAVQFAHDRAVIHRDLKPANIMLEHGEIPRLADFGLAKNMHEEDGLTMTGQVMGTPSYMAPEQAAGKRDEISNRTDVYSLGATLYALLAGKPPFSGVSMLETIRQVVRNEPEPLTDVSHSVPRDLQTICIKCLSKSPQHRYQSASEVADDLRCYLDGFPISARPLAPWSRGLRWCQRNPLEAALLMTTATALIVGAIVSVRFGLEANRQAKVAKSLLFEANENAQRLRESIKESFIFASEDVLAQEPGMQAARAVLLDSAQHYYAELVAQTPRDTASQSALAEAQFMLAKVHMAMGKDERARQALSLALTIQKNLTSQESPRHTDLLALSKTHNQLARLAKKVWQILTQPNEQGKVLEQQAAKAQSELEAWQHHAAEVVRLRKRVVDMEPGNIESLRLLASATMNQGVAIGQLGYAQHQLVQQDRARQLMLKAQEIRLRVLQENSELPQLRRDLTLGYFNLANTEFGAAEQELDDEFYFARLQVAVDDLTEAINANQKLTDPEQTLETRYANATCYRLRADAHTQLEHEEEAAEDYQKAEKMLRSLSLRNPNVYRYRIALAELQHNYCSFLIGNTKYETAVHQFTKCRETMLQALRVDPENEDIAKQLVRFTLNVAKALTENEENSLAAQLLGDTNQALQSLIQESAEYESLQIPSQKLKIEQQEIEKMKKIIDAPTVET